MSNLRQVNDDILKDWLDFREQEVFCTLTEEDKKHFVYFDEISEKILKNVPSQNKKYVKKQLDLLDKNFTDYICYWNEKYYRNGFCDGVQLIMGCSEEQKYYNCATKSIILSTDVNQQLCHKVEKCGTIVTKSLFNLLFNL